MVNVTLSLALKKGVIYLRNIDYLMWTLTKRNAVNEKIVTVI